MKQFYVILTLLLSASAHAENTLSSDQEKLSYSFGQQVGQLLQQQGAQYDIDALILGLKDAISDQKPRIAIEDMQKRLIQFQSEQTQKRAQAQQAVGESNQKTGAAFLAANKSKPNIVTTSSGLQYQIVKAGTGQSPTASSTVATHYHGTLIDGTVFDSSYSRGEPLSFQVNGVIPGWTEALQLMKPGAKWKIFVPSDLAYGARGAGEAIGAHATLIFDIELISVK